MNLNEIHDLINCLKRILHQNSTIPIPNQGSKEKIELTSTKYSFVVDLNRSGHKKPKCTFQLRAQHYRDTPLLRLDLIGRAHSNPPGDYPLANERIPCPHIHIIHPDYGDKIAYPLDDSYAKMYLKDESLEDLAYVLKQFLKRCNVGNIDEYEYQYHLDLF
ncbi:hypothetical protein LCM20_09540 [Halobacillus litoralis]|uniref:DUF6978 family protein n=1 Tax=Halobacillus litoralis TaxID=45668 RepID=UPI001CD49A38|nr:hypothetical protein [Halobacillus litoralis]MCA0970832.1 hypothetical protein [Halobacillus litoralis]